jgi:hypothetical protein
MSATKHTTQVFFKAENYEFCIGLHVCYPNSSIAEGVQLYTCQLEVEFAKNRCFFLEGGWDRYISERALFVLIALVAPLGDWSKPYVYRIRNAQAFMYLLGALPPYPAGASPLDTAGLHRPPEPLPLHSKSVWLVGVCGYEIFLSVRFSQKPRFRFGFGFPKIYTVLVRLQF